MTTSSETRVWQSVGAALAVIGGITLCFAFVRYGFASIVPSALNWGIAASFLTLAGVVAFSTGRALGVEHMPMGPGEARLWRLLTIVCLTAGVTTLVYAPTQHEVADRLAIGLAGAFTLIVGIVCRMALRLARAQQENIEQKQEIQKQQELAESLLLNILPAGVATELKQKGVVDPQYHEDVTILFTDFKGFTLSSTTIPADELVATLHNYFTVFDEITSRYGLEKLKTIGDSYMCVGGLPERRSSHAVDAVLAALEMVQEVVRICGTSGTHWPIRIGVHTGPVVSGVVGIRKFAFDIWGDSVNLASRMESSGAVNRVNLSEVTHSRVKDFFLCEHRGKVGTKDGREFDMYFATSPLPALTQTSDNGVPVEFAKRYETYFRRKLPSFPKGVPVVQ